MKLNFQSQGCGKILDIAGQGGAVGLGLKIGHMCIVPKITFSFKVEQHLKTSVCVKDLLRLTGKQNILRLMVFSLFFFSTTFSEY